MANARKRISELPPLSVASLDTTFVLGISGSTTYKISINNLTSSLDTTFATDLVTATLSNTLDTKLSTSSFNSYTASAINGTISGSSQLTSSYDQRYVISGSITQTTWDNIANKPSGIVSQSTDLSSLNTFTQSIDNRVDSLESWSSSLTDTFATDLEVSIVSSSVAATIGIISQNTGLVTTSSFNQYTASISTGSLVNRLNAIESVSGSWITESETGSFLTSLNGAISSSEQVLGNSGVYSSSAQINGNIYSAGSSVTIQDLLIGAGTTFGKITTDGGKYISVMPTYDVESARFWANGNVTIQNAGTYVDNGYKLEVSGSTRILGSFIATDGITGSTNFDTIVNKPTLISGSSQLTSSYDIRYAPSASYLTSLNGAISSSTQVLGGNGIYSSSAQLPSGLISGSSQLTASYDTRYTLSGSVVSGTTPAGTISGSSQLTSSFDGRYTQTGSFNTLTASFNSFTASAQSVTTGSNSFNGTQTITGSLIITTGSFVASQILANTASLYLTSGSNMYVQNNGVVEITGSLRVSGSAAFNVNVLSVDGRSGDEGGEINLAIPVTNTTLQNRVAVDIFQNRLRIFEGSADAKGVYIDLSKAPAGNSAELLTKASGLVDRGTDVTLGNLKVRFASTGNMSLQLSTITGTYSVYGSGIYTQNGSTIGSTIDAASPRAISTTPAYLISGYNFGTAGATDTWVIMDTSNTICWRITMIVGASYTNNFISIERLH